LVLLFAEVHPFGTVTAEPITVDLVSPSEAMEPAKKAEPAPEPKVQHPDSFDVSSEAAPSNAPSPAAPETTARQKAALSSPTPIGQQPAVQAQRPATSPSPSFVPPEPDLSVKYHVLLGLPPELPRQKADDSFDAPASQTADVASSLVTEFRRHLKACAKLPKSIAPSDPIKIKLRLFMSPDGKLAADPVLIEASASLKGPALMQSVIAALETCQPYAMLPAERYGEWKVLDVSFTPQDLSEQS
jgi:hypothetical protein